MLKLTGPRCLFMLNRYFPIFCVIFEMTAYFTDTFSHEVCICAIFMDAPFDTNLCTYTGVSRVWLLKFYISDGATSIVDFLGHSCAKRVVPFIIAANVISQCLIGSTHCCISNVLLSHSPFCYVMLMSPLSVILLLRTYALYQRSNTILLLVSTAWMAGTLLGIVCAP